MSTISEALVALGITGFRLDFEPSTFEELQTAFHKAVGVDENNSAILENNTNSIKFSWDEIVAKKIELQAEYDAQQYARSRASEYPSIGDQLDALFHAGVFPADMAAQIQAVKDKYPKGGS